jgi:thiosulfate reductase cytochrome b subunit
MCAQAVETSGPAVARRRGRLVRRQHLATRITHWTWAVSLFFLLLSGLQIFNAHPALYVGKESGFAYHNAVLEIGSGTSAGAPAGLTTLFGKTFVTTGFLGLSGNSDEARARAFPGWLTIPSYQDLATGRVVHFFFAWILISTLATWTVLSILNRHIRKDLVPGVRDVAGLGRDIVDHLRFRFHHGPRYSPLQKLAYAGVLFVVFPLIVLTGLAMSPGMDAALPWLLELFGGRQSARALHFLAMSLLVAFFVVHIAMVLAAGPVNELRSMTTGLYRLSPRPAHKRSAPHA